MKKITADEVEVGMRVRFTNGGWYIPATTYDGIVLDVVHHAGETCSQIDLVLWDFEGGDEVTLWEGDSVTVVPATASWAR
jgi:hypothetical protein